MLVFAKFLGDAVEDAQKQAWKPLFSYPFGWGTARIRGIACKQVGRNTDRPAAPVSP